jgi:hypothetical protein
MTVVVLVEQLTLLRVGWECIGRSSTLRRDEKPKNHAKARTPTARELDGVNTLQPA